MLCVITESLIIVRALRGWAMQSPAMTFGWVANPMSGVARESISVPVVDDGDYDLYLYRTWSGEYLPPIPVASSGGALTVKIPELVPVGQHAQNINDDVAFKLVKKGVAIGVR